MSGLSSESMTFLFRMLHQILPCRDRLARIFPRVEANTCKICDSGDSDTLLHSLAACPSSRDSFNWMMNGLGKYSDNLTPQKILLLDIEPSLTAVPLPHHQLSLIWFTAEVLRRIFGYRRDEKKCRLYEIRAELEAEVNLLRRSKYADVAVILDTMMDN